MTSMLFFRLTRVAFLLMLTMVGSFSFGQTASPSPSIWFSAQSSSDYTLTSGKVSQWNSRGALTGKTITQSTAAFQPTYVASAINGKPAINFTNSSALTFPAIGIGTTPIVSTKASFNMVIRTGTDVTATQIIYSKGTSASSIALYIKSGQLVLVEQVASSFWINYAVANITASTNYVVTGLYNSTGKVLELYLNGVLIGSRKDTGSSTVTFAANQTADFGSVTGSTAIQVSGTNTALTGTPSVPTNYYQGMIAEFMYHDEVLLTTSDRKGIEDYLMVQYGIIDPTKCIGCLDIFNRSSVWLKADAITSLANGAAVTAELTDKSGNGLNAVNNAAPNKPVFNTNIINGRPAINFLASSATTPRNLVLPYSNILNAPGYGDINRTYFFVINTPDVSGRQVIYKEGDNTQCIVIYINNGVLYSTMYVNSTFKYEYHTSISANQSVLIEVDKIPNGWQVNYNGTFAGYSYVVNPFVSTLTSTVSIGSADETQTRFWDGSTSQLLPASAGTDYFPFKGYIAEIAVLDKSNNAFEKRDIENGLALKYGIQIPNDDYRWQETHTYDLGAIGNDPAYAGAAVNTSSCSDIIKFRESNTSDGKFVMLAHDNASKSYTLNGYVTSTDNAPKNVQRMSRTWRAGVTTFPSTIGGSKTVDFLVNTNDFSGAAYFQNRVLIVDNDNDFKTGSKVYVFNSSTVINGATYFVVNGITINDGDYVSLGFLTLYEYSSGYNMNLQGLGKADSGFDVNTINSFGLTLTASTTISTGNYIVSGTTAFITTSFNSSPVPPGTTGTSGNQIWKLNHYGKVGPIDLVFNPATYPGGGYPVTAGNDFVLMIDPTGAASFTSASTYVNFVYEAGAYRAFGVTIPNGSVLAIASVVKAVPTETTVYKKILKESLGEISAGTPIPMRLLGKDVQPYKYTTPCERTVDKASLYITLNTGDDYLLGAAASPGIAFSATVIAKISSRHNGGTYIDIQTCTLTVNNGNPEQLYVYDLTPEYASLPFRDFKVTVVSSTLPSNTTIKNSLQLQSELVEESRRAVTITPASPIINQVAQDVGTATGVYQFTWDSEFCDAPLYQFQLLRLYNAVDYVPATSANDRDMRSADVDWSKALTLETTTKSIQLTLAEGTGYYIWRVRPVGTFYTGGTANDQNWGVWSTPPGLTIPLTILNGADLTPYKGMIFYYDQFDRDKNFIYNRAFTEDGKIHEGISYANGLQQSLQTQSRVPSNGTTGQVIVSETVYDYSGRPAVNSIPAPDIATGSNYLGFRSLAMQKSSKPYAALNFDKDANYAATDPLDNGLINLYYSDANTAEPMVPDAELYPYSRILYDNDGLNRTKEQGAPGPKLTTGSGHTVRIAYGAVTDAELIRVFGDEAPKSSTVSKMVTTDQNNISTVSYTDMTGKVIATCLIKNTLSTNLQPISATATPGFTIIEKLDNNTALPDNGISAIKPFVFTEATTLHVAFELTPAVVNSSCVTYCLTCAYKVLIRVRNVETGSLTEEAINLGPIACPGTGDTRTLDIPVTPGKYTVEKIVMVDDSGSEKYAKEVVTIDSTAMKNFVDANIMTYIEDPDNIDIEGLNAQMQAWYTAPPLGYTISVQRADNTVYTGGVMIDGDKVTISSNCCSLTIPIMIPDIPPCKVLLSDRSNASSVAEIFAAKYEQAQGTGWTWSLPSKVGAYARDTEFKVLIANMLNEVDGLGNYVYTCENLWNCWNGQIAKNLSGGLSVDGVNPIGASTEQSSANMSDQPAWAVSSITGMTDPNGGKPDIEQFLDCAGYHYKGYLKNIATDAYRLKTEAYKLFLYNRPTDPNPNTGQVLCENTFCKMGAGGIPVSPCDLVMCPRTEASVSTYFGLQYLTAVTPSTVYTLLTETEYFNLNQCLNTQQYDGSIGSHQTYDDKRAEILAKKAKMENDCNGACDGKRDKFIAKLEALYPKDGGGIRRNEQGEEVEYANICCTADKLVEYCKDQCYLSLNQVRCPATGINASDPVKIVSLGTVEEMNAVMAIIYGDFELEDASTTSEPCSTDYRTVEMCYSAVGFYHLSASTDVDGSPNLKNATVTGTILTGGRTSTSKYINAASAYATCSSDDSRGILKNVTVSAWVKKSSASAGTQVIVDKMGSTQGFKLYLIDDFLYFDVKDNGTLRSSGPSIFPMASTKIDPTKWHFVTGVCRDTSVEVWIDGEFSAGFYLPASTFITDIGSTNTTSLKIGASSGSFQGLIDEVYVYACALGKGGLQKQYQQTQVDDLVYSPEPNNTKTCGEVASSVPVEIWQRATGRENYNMLGGVKKVSTGKMWTFGLNGTDQTSVLFITSPDGTVVNKTIGSSCTWDVMISTKDGNYVLAGYSKHSDGAFGHYNSTAVKLDPNGEVIWYKEYVSTKYLGHCKIVESGDDLYLLSNVSYDGPTGTKGTYLRRLNSSDGLINFEQFVFPGSQDFGFADVDPYNPVFIKGNYIYLCTSKNVYKIDKNTLVVQWTVPFDTKGAYIKSVFSLNNKIVVAGTTPGYDAINAAYLKEETGEITWEVVNWSIPGNSMYTVNFTLLSNGQIGFLGSMHNSITPTTSTGFFIKMSPDGIDYYLDAITSFQSVKETTDGYLLTGTASAGSLGTSRDIVKIDKHNSLKWKKVLIVGSYPMAGFAYTEQFNDNSLFSIGNFAYSITGTDRTVPLSCTNSTNNSCTDYWFLRLDNPSTDCTRQPICIKWKSTPATVTVYDPVLPPNDQPALIAAIIKNLVKDQLDGCNVYNREALYQEYRTSCKAKITETTTVSYSLTNDQYTLYYYDRAGNLVKTVPPAGVEVLDVSDPTSDIMKRKIPTAHRLTTTYKYNSLAQLVEQYTPDGKTTKFIYNRLGMLRFSQNAKQVADQTYSYTKYDELGRVIEVGQASETLAGVPFASLNDPQYLDGTTSGSTAFGVTSYPNATAALSQQTITVYTTPALQYNYLGTSQRYLRNRVSYTLTRSVKNDQSVTAYSYDPHGNVEWVVQDVPSFAKNAIGYEYDLISNKVTKVKYNEKRIDQLYHRYAYDVDNRITGLSTSFNGYIWDNDARYNYYKYGPLKRAELGEDKVQGLDYTYTINGWMKALNAPSLSSTDDPGHDTQSGDGYTPDEFGFALGYYKGDFKRGVAPFNELSTYTLDNTTTELFNGNISTWVTQIKSQGLSSPTGQRFTYDYLNRLLQSDYTTTPSPTTTTYGTDYKTTYTYDRNGNIKTLTRNTAAGVAMDNLSYTYYNEGSGGILLDNNRLNSVSDIGPGSGVSPIDIDNTQATNNYVYDNIGNLKTDVSENTNIKWTVYGKVDEVKRTTPNVAGKEAETRFIYDAAGNRIAKEVNAHPYTSGGVYQRLPENLTTTYYVRDASGNIMSIYGRYNLTTITPGYYDAVFYLQEQPLYGSSRVGQYNTNSQTVELGRKRFQTSEVDNVQLDFNFVTKKSENVFWATPIAAIDQAVNGASTSLMPSIKLNAIGYTSGTLQNVALTRVQNFCGVVGSDVTIVETDGGTNVLFYMVSMKKYWGKSDVLLLFDGLGRLMPNSGGINAGSGSRNVVVKAPGEYNKYFLITRGTDKKLYSHTIDLQLVGNGTVGSPGGDVTSMNNLLDSKLYGSHLIALEDRSADKAYIYATTSTTPPTGLGTLNVVVFEVSALGPKPIKAPQVMCQSLVSRQDLGESELKISSDAKKILVYNHLQNAGWFGLQKSEVLIFNLGANYKVGANYAAEMVKVPAGWSLPKQSLEFSNDNRFIYFGSERLTLTTSATFTTPTAKEFSRYDIRDNVVSKEAFYKGVNGNMLRAKTLKVHIQDRTVASTATGGLLRSYLEDATTTVTSESTSLNFSLAARESNTGLLSLQNHIRFSTPSTTTQFSRAVNTKAYELSDHLGNVSVVLSDMKTAVWSGATLTGNTATLISYSNYYPFGMLTDKVSTPNVYRYGFNGKEKDDDLKGSGNSYDFGDRIYDPRLGGWLSVDPLQRKYAGISPYVAFADNPIYFTDPDGREIYDGKVRVFVTYVDNKPVFTRADKKELSENFVKNAQRLMNAMAKTEIGRDAISIWDKSPAKMTFEISKLNPGGEFGKTVDPPYFNLVEGVDKTDGKTLEHVIIYEGAIDDNIANPDKDRFGDVVDKDEALGAIGTHEAFHKPLEQMLQDEVTGTDERLQSPDKNLPINSEVTFREQYRANQNVGESKDVKKYVNKAGDKYKGLEKKDGKYTVKK